MPFLDKTGLAHLWNHIVARLNGKAEMSDLSNLEASLENQIEDISASVSTVRDELQTNIDKKANTSHGNHVPATQTASNNVFLRNDNTWATVTPANIGAAASSHNHTVSNITDLTVTAAELNYIDGVESNVQAQLDGKAALSHNHVATEITSGTLSSDRLPTVPITKGGTGATTAAGALTNLGLTATAAELNKLDGVTATTAELNYVDGVTSNIQTQLNGKAAYSHTHSYLPLSGGTLTGELKIEGYDDDYLKLKADIETVSIASVDGTNNATLVIGVNKTQNEKLQLTTLEGGTLKQYKIYGEHNKPTAADVGARASTWVPSASDITSGTLSSDRLSTIPITKGGTGGTTVKAAEYNILKDLSETTTAVSDSSQIVFKYSEPSTTKGALLYKKASTIYDYIADKLTPADIGAVPQKCAYYASGSTVSADTCNDSFALFASSLVGSTLTKLLGNPGFIYIFTFNYTNSNYKLQIAFPYNLASSAVAVRQSNSGTWKAWTRIDNHAPLTSDQYGTALPTAGTAGRIFFKKVT